MMNLNKILASFLFLIVTITVLILLSQLTIYSPHLSVDIAVFYDRANYFINNFNLKGLISNEYQPGASLFFVLLSPVLLINNSYDSFKLILFATNILLIIGLAYFYKQIASENIVLFSLLLLFTGPIIFFRFDLLVSLLVVAFIILWNKQRYLLSTAILALATTIKVYPLIFLPYILITVYKNFGIKTLLKILIYFFGIISTFIIIYSTLFQVSLQQILSGLNFHALKPVSTDNLYGLLITFNHLNLFGQPPQLISAYGTNGLANENIILPLAFYNYFWVVPFILIHIPLIKGKIYTPKIDVVFYLTNLLFFLIFTKSIAPQYMLWFITLLPLLSPNIYLTNQWVAILFLTFLSLFFYQYIYPLNYNLWLDAFRPPFDFHSLLFLNILRNIFMIIIAVKLFTIFLRDREIAQSNRRIYDQQQERYDVNKITK